LKTEYLIKRLRRPNVWGKAKMTQAVVIGASEVEGFDDVKVLPIFLLEDGKHLRLQGHHIITQEALKDYAGLFDALKTAFPSRTACTSSRPNIDQTMAMVKSSISEPAKIRHVGEAGVSRISIAAAWNSRSSLRSLLFFS
jgi:hypothetical protein